MGRNEVSAPQRDRVGIGWRPEIGIEILQDLDGIDVIEVVAENCEHLRKDELKAFSRLSSRVGIVVHAVSLGLASTFEVCARHLARVARVVDAIGPEAWSEHLAFVRIGDRELGHLAAPPWCEETVDGALRNIEAATRAVGSAPHLENIATLYLPLGCTLSEAEWTRRIIQGARTKLLIDLENIYANNRNFGQSLGRDAVAELLSFPLPDTAYVHIAGGAERHDETGSYFVDDHLSPVPPEVFFLLEELAANTVHPLTVILERDGNYPHFSQIQGELAEARRALGRGRNRRDTLRQGAVGSSEGGCER